MHQLRQDLRRTRPMCRTSFGFCIRTRLFSYSVGSVVHSHSGVQPHCISTGAPLVVCSIRPRHRIRGVGTPYVLAGAAFFQKKNQIKKKTVKTPVVSQGRLTLCSRSHQPQTRLWLLREETSRYAGSAACTSVPAFCVLCASICALSYSLSKTVLLVL